MIVIIKVIFYEKNLKRLDFYEKSEARGHKKTRRSGLCKSFVFYGLPEEDTSHHIELVFVTRFYIPFFIDRVI